MWRPPPGGHPSLNSLPQGRASRCVQIGEREQAIRVVGAGGGDTVRTKFDKGSFRTAFGRDGTVPCLFQPLLLPVQLGCHVAPPPGHSLAALAPAGAILFIALTPAPGPSHAALAAARAVLFRSAAHHPAPARAFARCAPSSPGYFVHERRSPLRPRPGLRSLRSLQPGLFCSGPLLKCD